MDGKAEDIFCMWLVSEAACGAGTDMSGVREDGTSRDGGEGGNTL